ncbi:MAG: UvrD-helicase domain-containing protein [Gammaproteobacteria bacterium]|nr:UvrD-helicase domain-containing protein [Gammaproteobacteria bacterium]
MTNPAASRKPIDLSIASAGTGKTTQLVGKIQEAIDAGTETRSILATTFTNKAATELVERARSRLIGEGKADQASGLLSARVGTVNATFGGIVNEFALNAGRSPVADVITEERQGRMFAIAAETSIARHAGRMIPVAQRLEMDGWEEDVRKLADLVRQNDVDPACLDEQGQRSWGRFRSMLPEPMDQSAEAVDASLRDALREARNNLRRGVDTTKATAAVMEVIDEACAVHDSGRTLSWRQWAQLSKLSPGVSSRPVVQPVVDIAMRHAAHPGLHRDVRAYIEGTYGAAAAALGSYAEYKATNGLVDFIDQEHVALRLLDDTDVSDRLRESLDRVFVDEFQDTSPIQLALFLKVSQIAERSFWVGDPKQAIYGFRGTDPELIGKAAAEVVPRSGGERGTLSTSYRSRPGLVGATNRIFVPAFETLGFDAETVCIENCARLDADGQGEPIEVWSLSGSNWDVAIAALAESIRTVLDEPDAHAVDDRALGGSRPIRGSDIAVLCRSNNRCREVAAALGTIGIHSSIARPGLLATPEAVLAVAALRYLVDPGDSLAIAEIAHLLDDTPGQPAWFERSLSDLGIRSVADEFPALRALDKAREQLAELTPRETLEVAMTAAGVLDRVCSWGNALDRTANLDALRGLAVEYEDEARIVRSAATAAGLVSWLGGAAGTGSELPPSTDPGAVNVLTYHRAKGLEWPMVVLLDLQSARDPSAFGFNVETGGEFDVWEPLKDRWVRFWPWPYGRQRKNVYLDTSVLETAEHRQAARREQAESVRLLYVGMTRARDYLVLAARGSARGGLRLSWLDLLVDADGRAVVDSSRLDSDAVLVVSGEELPVRYVQAVAGDQALPPRAYELISRMSELATKPQYPAYRIAPSEAGTPAPGEAKLISRVRLGERIPLVGSPDMGLLGEAVHAFLAFDRPGQDAGDRRERAVRTLARWGVAGIDPEHLVDMSDRLFTHLNSAFPGMTTRSEVPVFGRRNGQRVSGRIDLLLTGDGRAVVIDHKTYPGAFDTWEGKALGYASQLALYASVTRAATGCTNVETWVHMPIVGHMLRVRAPDPMEMR